MISLIYKLREPSLSSRCLCIRRHVSIHSQVDQGPARQRAVNPPLPSLPGELALAGQGERAQPGASFLCEYFPSSFCGSRRSLMLWGLEEGEPLSVPIT